MCLAYNYAVSGDAEEKQVSEYFGKVAVSYPPHTGAQCGACFRLSSVLRVDDKHCWGQLQLSSMEPCSPSPERGRTNATTNARCRWRHYQEGQVESSGWCCLQDGAGMLHTERPYAVSGGDVC